MNLELRARAAAAILELAFNPHQRRGPDGRWIKMSDWERRSTRPVRLPRKSDLGGWAEQVQYGLLTGEAREQVERMFGFKDPKTGLTARVDMVSVLNSAPGHESYVVDMSITGDKGQRLGKAQRTIQIRPDGVVRVNHDTFNIDESVRRGGFSTRWLRRMEDRYRKAGVDDIALNTVGVGSYAWAKAGFDFDDDYVARFLAGDLLEKLPSDTPPEVRAQAERLKERADAGGDERPLPIEFAMLGWTPGARNWPGKDAIVQSFWSGVKKL